MHHNQFPAAPPHLRPHFLHMQLRGSVTRNDALIEALTADLGDARKEAEVQGARATQLEGEVQAVSGGTTGVGETGRVGCESRACY